MAQKVAWLKGAKRVIGIDKQEYRLETARRTAKSETLNFEKVDVIEAIRDMTDGRGADVCIDAAGMEADRSTLEKVADNLHLQGGTLNALKMCCSAVRRGGFVTVVGRLRHALRPLPARPAFRQGRVAPHGPGPGPAGNRRAHRWVEKGVIVLDDIISHRLPIEDAPRAYQIFRDKEDNCVKVVLNPHAIMNNETVLVTGASSGIGRELARQFAMNGHPVILTATSEGELGGRPDNSAAEYGVTVRFIAADLLDPEAAAGPV